jgi:CRP-like cAMP-binding protein
MFAFQKSKQRVAGRPSLGANVHNMGKFGQGLLGDVTKGMTKLAVSTTKALQNTTKAIAKPSEDFYKRKIFPTVDRIKSVKVTQKAEQEQTVLLDALKSNFIFANLDADQLQTLAGVFEKCSAKKEECIIKQGDEGDYFYILYKGQVAFEVDGETVGSSEDRGDDNNNCCFGELALLYSSPRAASVYATEDCILFRLDRVNFRHIMQKRTMEKDEDKLTLLKSIPELAELEAVHLRKLVSAMTAHNFQKGEVLNEKGQEMNFFIVIQSGKVHATDIMLGGSKYEDSLVGPGESQTSLGWHNIFHKEALSGKVEAVTNVTAFAIDGETFQKVVGNYDQVVQKGHQKRQLRAVAVFRDSRLDDAQVSGILDLMHHRKYRHKKTICKAGDEVEAAIYFVRSGSVTLGMDKGKTTETIDTGGYFGENSMLLDQNKDAEGTPVLQSSFTVIASKDCALDVLYLEDCRKVVDTTLLGLGKPTKVSALEQSLEMSDLTKHTMLGAGSFGQVWLVSAPESTKKEKRGVFVFDKRRVFALKVQSKHQLIESDQAEGVVAERNIMASLKSPFIIRLYNTFQDDQLVYMVTSLLQGGELSSVIPDDGLFESSAKFYAAGILEGLTYMHRRHIIHRDIKPENILIDSKGYPVLIDLGFGELNELHKATHTSRGKPPKFLH